MNKKGKTLLPVLIFLSTLCVAQHDRYAYFREITGITDVWHKIEIPEEVFGNLQQNLSDLRIIGVDAQGDTIEAPYMLNIDRDEIEEREIKFNLINESTKNGDTFFTFEVMNHSTINEIELEFQQKNFDWRISLSGSQDHVHWFDLVDDYRILSIQNEMTDYHFTKILLPSSNYQFYQLKIASEDRPILIKAFILLKEVDRGKIKSYEVKSLKQVDDSQSRQSIVDLKINQEIPVSRIKINFANEHDFYRPITIQYLSDSFETENGWKYQYTSLTEDILTSLEDQEFSFRSTILDNLHIIIDNHDNEPLKINSCKVEGFTYELIGRFTEEFNYWLFYGNADASKPNYDIAHFTNQIPDSLSYVQLGDEQLTDYAQPLKPSPLFENKAWLWGMLLLIILLLGYFSIMMIKKG